MKTILVENIPHRPPEIKGSDDPALLYRCVKTDPRPGDEVCRHAGASLLRRSSVISFGSSCPIPKGSRTGQNSAGQASDKVYRLD